ncbi:MAG: YdbH domain-containing protein, partial [Pseudomonadota bacterium]|nr:YdbH domain-containing protein [Pseudomonadota bacterium]
FKYYLCVNRKKTYLLIAALLFCALLASLLFNLPGILRHQLEARLAASGFELQSVEVASLGLNAAGISGMELRSVEDELLIKLGQIQLRYQPGELFSGVLQGMSVGNIEVHLPESKSLPLMEQLRQLKTLLEGDWRDTLPLREVTVEQISVFQGGQITPLMSAQLEFGHHDDVLQGKIVPLPQQQRQRFLQLHHRGRGEWLLEAINEDQQPLMSATLQMEKESPLTIRLHSDMQELRAWGALFGFPLPQYEAEMDVALSLAPDFENNKSGFVLDGKAEQIDVERAQLQRAELSARGEIQLQQSGVQMDVTSDTSLFGLKRGSIASEQLKVNSTAQLAISDSGLQGVFDVDLRSKSISRDDVSLEEASFIASGEVEVTDDGLNGKLDAGAQLQSGAMQIRGVSVESLQMKSAEAQLFSLLSDNSNALWSVGENRLEIKHEGAGMNSLELATGSIELQYGSWSYPLRQSLDGEIATPGVTVKSGESTYEFGSTKGRFEIDAKLLTIEATTRYNATATGLSLKMQQSLQQGSGKLSFNSKAQSLEKLGRAMKRTTAAWPRDLLAATGTAKIDGSVAWDGGLQQSRVDIRVSKGGGRYAEVYFSGLNADLKLDLYPKLAGRAKKVSVKLIDIGVPVSNLSASLRLGWPSKGKKPVLTFSNLRASLLKGRVTGKRVRIDLNRRRHDFTLALQHIDIAEVVRLHGFEGLNATGKVSGTLPVRLDSKGVSVSKGRIRADKPGGTINYIPDAKGEAVKSASLKSEVLLNLLRDFRYDVLDAETEYKTDGQLLMKMQLKGKSPQQYKERPVHLNLTLDQNILSLLKSLRSVNGLNERIDRKVRQSYKQ